MTLASPPPSAAPPPPTPADTKRVKAMTRTVAMDLRRHGTPALGAADKAWLEGQPQSLWSLLDTAVAISTAGRRDEVLITASRWLLANQLELIRYRLERDHDWARAMLDAYQEKLIALVRAKTVPGGGLVRVGQPAQDREGTDPARNGRGAGPGCRGRDARGGAAATGHPARTARNRR